MTEWKEYKLENVTKRVKVGYVGSCEYAYCEPSDNAVPMIRTTNLSDIGLDYSNMKYVTKEFHEKNRKSQLHYGDILIARHGENGKASRYTSRNEANCLNVVVVEPDENQVTSLFIKYLFDTPYVKEQIRSSVVGSVQDVVNTKTIANLKVRIPAQDTVQNIVSILSSLDDKIVMNKKICENLEAQAQALFKHWFVDFAPFKDGKFVESELGLIPEGWRVGTLSEVADLVKTSIKPQGNTLYSHYSIPAFDNNQTPSCDSGESIKSSKFAIQDSVIMLSKLNPEHKRIWFIQNVGSNAVCSTEFLPFYAKDRGQSVFVYCYLNCPQNYREIANGAKGTTNSHQRLDANAVLTRKLAYKNDVVTRFSKLVGDFMKQKDIALQENLRLSTLRDTLLPKLMSGEIKI